MKTPILARLVEIAGTMLAVSFIVYLVLEANSGDVAVKVLGPFSTEDQRALWMHQNGYDAPFLWRYLEWLARFAVGDWGMSTHYRVPVWQLLPERLGRTAMLAGATLVVMIPVSFSLGILAGMAKGSVADRIISFFCVATTSIPEFASSVFLAAIFVFWLGVLPGASSMTSGFAIRELVLPTLVLALYSAGYLARITRASMVEVMEAPYIRAAMMRGVPPARLVLGHALRNALVAPVTVIMLQIPWLLSGVIVVEVFFAYRGFGSLLYEAGLNSDIALIEACAMISVAVVLATQFLSDLIYAWLNPRLNRKTARADAAGIPSETPAAGAAP
ncbi:MAG: ABC transporter permease [Azospirillaceae bacterium]|nr:ABC transporter permease [Azospirillaceae bacterium]